MKKNFFQHYKANGYVIGKPLLEKIEISHLRSEIDNELKNWLQQVDVIKKG